VSLEEVEERFQRSLQSGDSAPELASTTWTDPEVEAALQEQDREIVCALASDIAADRVVRIAFSKVLRG
jgi:hypothetical protein